MNLLPLPIKEHCHNLYKKTESDSHVLLYLFLEITRLCNLSCRHCGSDCSSNKNFESLTTDSWISIIYYISQHFDPPPSIVLTGGEPIVHPDFEKIIKSLDSLNFCWGMVSNGYALNNELIDLLKKYHMHSITISLDGTSENHNWLRCKVDAYTRTIDSIKQLVSMHFPQMDIVTCVNKHNITELDEIAQTLISLGIKHWRLFRIFPAGRAKNNNDLLLSHQQTRALLEWIRQNKNKYRSEGLDVNYCCEGWVPFKQDQTIRDYPFFCRSGINIASVLSDGTITGCTNNAQRFHEGSILKDNFAHVWKNKFSQFRNHDWVEQTSCGKCEHIKKCQGSSIHLWRDDLQKIDFCYMEKH
jgi:radical SAM protein with 4Fe4S-binding SPASM domain